ncbi:MAG: EamA family transporter [Acidimicrobiales bacterium]
MPTSKLRRRPPAGLLVALGAISVQFGAALATHLFGRVGPGGAVTLRLVFAALALVAVNAPKRKGAVSLLARRVDLLVAASFGVVLGVMNLTFYEAIARVPLGVAVTIEFIGPLAVSLGGSRRLVDGLWAILAGLGVFLLAGGGVFGVGHRLDIVGVGFALLAGLCWAGYILLNAATGRRFSGTSGLALAIVVASIVVLPFGIAQAGGRLLTVGVLGLGIVVAFLSSVIPYSLELYALRRVSARAFGILLSMDPAFAALAGLLLLGQHLSSSEVVALILVVAANAGSSLFSSQTPLVSPEP